jgi:hypothetical protein
MKRRISWRWITNKRREPRSILARLMPGAFLSLVVALLAGHVLLLPLARTPGG